MRIQLIEEFQRFRQAAQNRDYRGAGETAAGVDWTVVRNFGLHNWRSQFPIANRILNVVGFKQQTCERCHELVYGGDPGQIKLCPNHECRKLYCANCFEVVKIRCIACGLKMSELDLSHDYYIDSSDESSEDEDDEDGEEGIEEDEDDEDEDEENEVP